MNVSKQVECEAAKMFAKAVDIANSKGDGERHRVVIILSIRGSQRWLSALVDDERVLGIKLGVGEQTRMHECVIIAPNLGVTTEAPMEKDGAE